MDLTPDEVFDNPKLRETYEGELNALWGDIVSASECVKDLQAILEVPGWLWNPGPIDLLDRLARTLWERAALRVTNALTDESSKNALTFRRLRRTLEKTCRASLRAQVKAELAAGFLKYAADDLDARAERVRHRLLAHFDSRLVADPAFRAATRLPMDDLVDLLFRSKELIQVLSLGTVRGFDTIPISRGHGMRDVLLRLLRENAWLTMPEGRLQDGMGPLVLRAFSKEWTERQRDQYNEWRERIGRTRIDFAALPEL